MDQTVLHMHAHYLRTIAQILGIGDGIEVSVSDDLVVVTLAGNTRHLYGGECMRLATAWSRIDHKGWSATCALGHLEHYGFAL